MNARMRAFSNGSGPQRFIMLCASREFARLFIFRCRVVSLPTEIPALPGPERPTLPQAGGCIMSVKQPEPHPPLGAASQDR